MDTLEIINTIKNAEKKTPVKVYANIDDTVLALIDFTEFKQHNIKIYQGKNSAVIIGDYSDIKPILEKHKDSFEDLHIENAARNSAIPLLDLKGINARIEPGAVIRDKVEIGNNAVIMMGAVINIGAEIGDGTMIDMGAILGGRAKVGKNSHIGAGAVLAGVIEPASAKPVTVGDDVLIGANAVVLEGVSIGDGAVVAAGAIVINDVNAGDVVAGAPAKVIKKASEVQGEKIEIVAALREL